MEYSDGRKFLRLLHLYLNAYAKIIKLLYLIMSIMQLFLKKNQNLITTLVILGASTLAIGLGLDYFEPKNTITPLILQQIILLSPVLICLALNKTTIKDIGFNKFNPIKAIPAIITSFIIYFSFTILIHLITTKLNLEIPGFQEQQSYQPFFTGIPILVVFLITSIIGPISEEILFRGLIFQQIAYSNTIKIIISALLFSLMHFQFAVILPLLLIGLILGKLRTIQNSIFLPIIFHCLNNSLATYADFFLR